MPQSDARRTVDLYVRSLAAGDNHARIEETLSRLAALERAGTIDEYDLHVWGDGVSLDPRITDTDAGAFIRERVTAFREWAHETGHELVGFAERTTHSAMTGRTHRNVTVPAMALCEYRDGDIEWVAPCKDQVGAMTTVADRLAALTTVDTAPTISAREKGQ